LVNNLLLLNQFPDVDADKTVGRRHYPIAVGRKKVLKNANDIENLIPFMGKNVLLNILMPLLTAIVIFIG